MCHDIAEGTNQCIQTESGIKISLSYQVHSGRQLTPTVTASTNSRDITTPHKSPDIISVTGTFQHEVGRPQPAWSLTFITSSDLYLGHPCLKIHTTNQGVFVKYISRYEHPLLLFTFSYIKKKAFSTDLCTVLLLPLMDLRDDSAQTQTCATIFMSGARQLYKQESFFVGTLRWPSIHWATSL